MKFGMLFTSQPNTDVEAYPYAGLHDRVTQEAVLADQLGFDNIWLAEHHFTDHYGIMPDVFVYAGYLAALTKRAMIGTAVVTLPLANPIRVVENAALVDLLSKGRFCLGMGSGYRPYEFEAFDCDFENRRDAQEEALEIVVKGLRDKRVSFKGKYANAKVDGDYQFYPVSLQQPHPPLYMAGATQRSIKVAGERGFGLFLSGLSAVADLGQQARAYREGLKAASDVARTNPAFGVLDICRWLYVAETDALAKKDTEAGVIRQFGHFFGEHTPGYLGSVAPKLEKLDYDHLNETTLLHGSPETVIRKIREIEAVTSMSAMTLIHIPWYGTEKSKASMRLFAEEVIPALKQKSTPSAGTASNRRHRAASTAL